jgi:hypothetical protein
MYTWRTGAEASMSLQQQQQQQQQQASVQNSHRIQRQKPQPQPKRQRRPAAAVGAAPPQLHDKQLLWFERRGFLVTQQLLQQQQLQAVKQCVQQVIAQDMLAALRHR